MRSKNLELALAPLGDSSAIVAYAGSYHGQVSNLIHHAVRVRIARISELAKTPDAVLVADENFGGLVKLWSGVFAFGRGDVGWLAVRADNSLLFMRRTRRTTAAGAALDSELSNVQRLNVARLAASPSEGQCCARGFKVALRNRANCTGVVWCG
jgi:hypothetical protein